MVGLWVYVQGEREETVEIVSNDEHLKMLLMTCKLHNKR